MPGIWELEPKNLGWEFSRVRFNLFLFFIIISPRFLSLVLSVNSISVLNYSDRKVSSIRSGQRRDWKARAELPVGKHEGLIASFSGENLKRKQH